MGLPMDGWPREFTHPRAANKLGNPQPEPRALVPRRLRRAFVLTERGRSTRIEAAATLLPRHQTLPTTVQPPVRPTVFVRRVRIEDAQTMTGFVSGLSAKSRRNRFHAVVSASPKLVGYLVTADGVRHAAWVACIWGANGEEIIGEAGWYVVDAERGSAELALSVLDSWQGSGVANRLMAVLMQGAREAGLRHIYGDVLDANARMLAFMRRHGLEPGYDEPPDAGVERVSCDLTRPPP